MITKEQYKEAKKVIKDYEAEQLNKVIVISSVCGLNREPNECSVNLYSRIKYPFK
jgi:hypothetical protein